MWGIVRSFLGGGLESLSARVGSKEWTFVFFFFQAEDGIRDIGVTGVQTCALPIFEGVFRQAAVYKGRNRDTAWYAAIDREWPALEAAFLRWLDPANFDERGSQRLRDRKSVV